MTASGTDAFYYRDDVRAIIIDAGCQEAMYDRYDDPTDNSTAKTLDIC